MSSCFGTRKKDRDTEPLLPRYEDETDLQRKLHQKLHTYQMLRALYNGYMPTTEQTIINLRTLLAADALNPNKPELSNSGKRLLRYSRDIIRLFIEIIHKKNNRDQLQEFLWCLSKSRLSVNTDDISHQVSQLSIKADASAGKSKLPANFKAKFAAASESLRTLCGLLLTNSDFRLFIDDLGTISRQVLADTASALSGNAAAAAKELEPDDQENKAISGPGADEAPPPTGQELEQGVKEVSTIVGGGAVQTGQETLISAREKLSGRQKQALLHRLKTMVLNLRGRTDYADSVSVISQLLQRYALAYSRAVDSTITATKEDVNTNRELDDAVRNFWALISSFGDRKQWDQLEQNFEKVMQHSKSDPDFEALMVELGNAVQRLLTDPDFFDSVDDRTAEVRRKIQGYGGQSGLRDDLDNLLRQGSVTMHSVMEDQDIARLIRSIRKIADILTPKGNTINPELMTDSLHIFLPLLIRSVQYLPIPRLEVSVPEMDLLIENLILEPGRTVNATSFLPYRLLITTRNDLEIRKAHSKRTTSHVKSLVTVSISGLTVCANDLGFWIRAHSGLFFRFADEGIASFALDERGIDVTLDLEIAKERLEEMLTLRAVRVHIHKLDYKLRRSKLSWLGWLVKPFLKHLIRRSLEKTLAENIASFLHAANRELVFARERLRATRIADPQDVTTFVKAVFARLTPEDDPDVYARVGVDAPKAGIFEGVYTPGSILKVWHNEAERASEAADIGEAAGGRWQNPIFDVSV
ncbi:MAG: hypothetical protein Q9227_006270 [Pyrenula ochraceoflavens]